MPTPASFMIKPSDAVAWVSCVRRVWLDNRGDFDLDATQDEFEELVIELGLAHEKAVLDKLSQELDVHRATSPEHTRQLMSEGVDVIYQAQLIDTENGFIGFPDFLIRHQSGDYQPADAKLSLSDNKKEIQAQLGLYRRMLGSELPALTFLGDGSRGEIGKEANKITEQFISEMRRLLASDTEPLVRYSHSKCKPCPYYRHCKPAFEEKEELSLLYGIQGRAALGLEAVGITTVSQLANTDPATIPDIPYLKGFDKKSRAVLQAKSYLRAEVHQRAKVALPEGHWVHFDIEDNPLTDSGNKHVYLWGFLVPDYQHRHFEYVWTDDESQDEKGWLGFLAQIEQYRERYNNLILAHYSSHERSTIRSYAKRYKMEDNETVEYLLGDSSQDPSPLFDMQKPILESLVLPLQGYGLKDICKHKDLVNFQWEDDSSGSQWSVVQFNHFLDETDHIKKDALKNTILGYNRDDVIATRKLEEWLRKHFM